MTYGMRDALQMICKLVYFVEADGGSGVALQGEGKVQPESVVL